MQVGEVMKKEVSVCHPEDTLADATTWMWKSDSDSLPVVDWEDRLVGQISSDDVRNALSDTSRTPAEVQVSEAMVRNVPKCSLEIGIEEAAHLMQENALRRLFVVNADEKLAGSLSLEAAKGFSTRSRSSVG